MIALVPLCTMTLTLRDPVDAGNAPTGRRVIAEIETIVAVWREDKAIDPNGELYVLSPCGYCRQFMRDINEGNLETGVILGRDKVVKLKDLPPYHEWPEPFDRLHCVYECVKVILHLQRRGH